MSHYQMEGSQVKNVQQSFSLVENFIERIHPDEQEMVKQETSDEALRALIASGGEKSFEARIKQENGTYSWSFIIIQGILPSRAQPENFMVFIPLY
jgi:hypothetical protein